MWKETRNVEREVRFMKIREGFDSINAAYTDDFFFIFFLFSRISNNNPVREKCRIYAMIQLGHKNCGSNRAVRTMEKQLDWPFRRSQNPACQASLLSPVLRSAYFSFFFLLLFFFPFFFHTRRLSNEVWLATVRENTARDSWFMRYLLIVAPSPSRFPSSSPRFCLLLVKFCFTSINHAMIIYEGRVGLAGGRFDLNMNKTIIHRNIFP